MVKRKKGLSYSRTRVSQGIQAGTYLNIADNSGAKVAMVIGVPGYKGRLRRIPKAGVGDLVVVSVKKGTPQVRKQIFYAVIIRQRKPYRRKDGTWIFFEDNAGVIITPDGVLKGTEIRGPVAKEAAEKWPRVANLATMIV